MTEYAGPWDYKTPEEWRDALVAEYERGLRCAMTPFTGPPRESGWYWREATFDLSETIVWFDGDAVRFFIPGSEKSFDAGVRQVKWSGPIPNPLAPGPADEKEEQC